MGCWDLSCNGGSAERETWTTLGFTATRIRSWLPVGSRLPYVFVFPRFGWRPLFFLGGLPALLALFVRFRVKESDVWKKTEQANWRDFAQVLVALHWKLLLYMALFMAGLQLTTHGTQDMYPTFLERYRHLGPSDRAWITSVSMIGAIIGGIVFGFFSDGWGRRRMIIVALIGALLAIPLWAFGLSKFEFVAGAVLMQFMIQGALGIVPAHLSELAPNSARGFLVGFGYQCGVLLSSSVVRTSKGHAGGSHDRLRLGHGGDGSHRSNPGDRRYRRRTRTARGSLHTTMTIVRGTPESGLQELQICFLPGDVQRARNQVSRKAKQHSRHGFIGFALHKIGLHAGAFCEEGPPC